VSAWLTPERRVIVERDYPAGCPWPVLRRRLEAADPAVPLPRYATMLAWANSHALHRPRSVRFWTAKETALVAELLARRATRDEFVAALPGRTWRGIYDKIRSTGMLPPSPRDAEKRLRASPAVPQGFALRCLSCHETFTSRDRCRHRICDNCHRVNDSLPLQFFGVMGAA
jgi:hypothetical protein